MTGSPGGSRRRRDDEGSILEGSWLWIALPVGILAVIAAVWFLIIAPGGGPPRATATPPVTETPWPTMVPVAVATPTAAEPTSVPTPTQPATIAVGARVEVTDTGAAQLRVRQLPGTNAVTLKFVPDGTKFVVIGGPEQAGGYTWWKVDDQAGLVGWAAGQYLKLAP